jgi:uncharacterized membrane protein YcaP (DUF421 family)
METYAFDLKNIFVGDLPILFYVEIVLRTLVLYGYTMAILRLLGRRSAGDLTVIDVVLIVALGSAVGDPMFYPKVPVLYGLLVITLIVGLQRLGLLWANHNDRVDRFIKGTPSRVIADGLFDLKGVERVDLSKREIFQMARQDGYRNLGEIRRMYIETDGKSSIFGFQPGQVRPGLQFEPPRNGDDQYEFIQAGTTVEKSTVAACTDCGQVAEFEQSKKVPPCPRCQQPTWSVVETTE